LRHPDGVPLLLGPPASRGPAAQEAVAPAAGAGPEDPE
jgi:hypothetical protein